MHENTTIRQLIAACLLAVFLFITLIKLFHSHETYPASVSASVEQVEKKADCAICDYHFTKDTDHQILSFYGTAQQPATIFCISYTSRTASSVGLSYSDRGPPALS
ncbi:MAG TPA: hypothetical protein VD996_15225 [Chitinophagaceae bacterium]|nr:hypothetical protein [Chitinophagaceae bacterium]